MTRTAAQPRTDTSPPRAGTRTARTSRLSLCVVAGLCLAGLSDAAAQPLRAVLALEGREFVLGEKFRCQIQISGYDKPTKPDVSHLNKDFQVQDLGGRNNNSSMSISVNGRKTHSVKRGFLFNYQLTPRRAGRLIIPPIVVRAGASTLRTRQTSVLVKKPGEPPDFRLKMKLSRPQCYVGEPVKLTLTWYIGAQPDRISFDVPVMKSADFLVPQPSLSGAGKVMQLGDRQIEFRQGSGVLDGKRFTTLTFELPLIPKRVGKLTIPQSTASCEVVTGYRNRQRRPGLGSSIFDDVFGPRRQPVMRRITVAAPPLELAVLDVPTEGRPANFAGHIGPHQLTATATPTEVNVGDPITLTVELRGPELLEDVELPPLNEQPTLVKHFKIPKEISPGRVEGRRKIFTQTVRATSADVTAIPPIELPYFDSGTGKYAIAATNPIPLVVKETEVLTAQDAEGHAPVTGAGRKLAAWSRGIAHNYEDLSALADQRHGPELWRRSVLWQALLAGPPLAYVVLLLSLTRLRRQNTDPLARRTRRAHGVFRQTLPAVRAAFAESPRTGYDQLLQALQTYMGSKLRVPAGALTVGDVRGRLENSGVTPETLADIETLFRRCESSRYAGDATGDADAEGVIDKAAATVKAIEQTL